MSNVPAVHKASPAAVDGAYVQHVVEVTARRLARSSFLPESLTMSKGQRRPVEDVEADLMVMGQTALDLGIPFNLQTLQKMPVIKGTADLMAQLLLGLVGARGHDAWVEERAMDHATVCLVNGRTKRKHTVTYTIDEAKLTPQYAANPTWKTNPADMLVARAVRRVVRQGAPEVLMSFPQAFDEDDAPTGPDWQWQEEFGERPELPSPGVLDPAPDRTRRVDRLQKRIQALPSPARARLIDEWQARTIPPVQHPDFGARLDDAEDLVDEITAEAFAMPPEADTVSQAQGGRREEPNGEPGTPEIRQSATGKGADEAMATAAAHHSAPDPDTGPARPLAQQIAIQAERHGIDRAAVIYAVTNGEKVSAKEVDAEEGQLVLEAIAAISRGEYGLEERSPGEWRFTPRVSPAQATFDQGEPFT